MIKKQTIKNVEKAVEDTQEKFYNEAYTAKESGMNQESWEYYNIAAWQKEKVNYNRISKFNANKHRQVLHGQIWYCDLGYNVGTEKNKMRPVLVMSNNKINNSEKVVVVCITDAREKRMQTIFPSKIHGFFYILIRKMRINAVARKDGAEAYEYI